MRRRQGYLEFISKVEGREKPKPKEVKHPLPAFWVPWCTFMRQYEQITQNLDWLSNAFSWSSTPQGYDFWSDVVVQHTRLDKALEILASWYLQLKELGYEAA
jgi:hypothetical protein